MCNEKGKVRTLEEQRQREKLDCQKRVAALRQITGSLLISRSLPLTHGRLGEIPPHLDGSGRSSLFIIDINCGYLPKDKDLCMWMDGQGGEKVRSWNRKARRKGKGRLLEIIRYCSLSFLQSNHVCTLQANISVKYLCYIYRSIIQD